MMKLVVFLCLAGGCALAAVGPGSPDCPKTATINQQTVPDPNDCTKYSECSKFFEAKFSCSGGDHFSPTELKCMSPWKAGCDPAYATTEAALNTEAAATDAAAASTDDADAALADDGAAAPAEEAVAEA